MLQCEVQVVGAGPAAMGMFLAADRKRKLSGLLDKGVVVFGGHSPIGNGGQMGEWKNVLGNSPAKDHLSVIDPSGAFGEVLDSEEARALVAHGENPPPLQLVGLFVGRIQRQLARLMGGFSRSAFLSGGEECRVQGVLAKPTEFLTHALLYSHKTKDPITWKDGPPSTDVCSSRQIVFATGARPKECHSGIFQVSGGRRVISAYDLMRGVTPMRGHSEVVVEPSDEIHIFGASHSAWATVSLLLDSAHQGSITVWGRRDYPKLYFASSQEAVAARYPFTDENVAPNGSLHRYCGVRPPYRTLVLQALAGKLDQVSFRKMRWIDQIVPTLSENCVLIAATGFEANRKAIYIEGQQSLYPRGPRMFEGMVFTDEKFRVHTEDSDGVYGRPIPGAYALGLGVLGGPRSGAELSHQGPIDAFNYYASKDCGGLVVDQIC